MPGTTDDHLAASDSTREHDQYLQVLPTLRVELNLEHPRDAGKITAFMHWMLENDVRPLPVGFADATRFIGTFPTRHAAALHNYFIDNGLRPAPRPGVDRVPSPQALAQLSEASAALRKELDRLGGRASVDELTDAMAQVGFGAYDTRLAISSLRLNLQDDATLTAAS